MALLCSLLFRFDTLAGEKEFFASRPTHTNQDLYAILQVKPDASQDDISAAYKDLAKALHPDRNTSASANEDVRKLGRPSLASRYPPRMLIASARVCVALGLQFSKLKEAYEVLRDPQKRAVYDKSRVSRLSPVNPIRIRRSLRSLLVRSGKSPKSARSPPRSPRKRSLRPSLPVTPCCGVTPR